jgi:hypothetical protein
LNYISLQKVESVPIFDSFMDCEVDPNGTTKNDIELGGIAPTQNVNPILHHIGD